MSLTSVEGRLSMGLIMQTCGMIFALYYQPQAITFTVANNYDLLYEDYVHMLSNSWNGKYRVWFRFRSAPCYSEMMVVALEYLEDPIPKSLKFTS